MRTTAVVAALGLALACAHGGSEKKAKYTPVSDADLGRLPPDRLGPIVQARADASGSHDAVARSQLRLQQAQQELSYAKADATAAAADDQRAAAEINAAKQAGDQGMMGRAIELTEAAKLRHQAADAHQAYAQKLVQAAQADLEAAKAGEALAAARLERAKLTALQQAEIPAATKYDPAQLEAHVAQVQQAEAAARTKASQADNDALVARQAWQGLDQRWQARVQGVGGRG